MSSSRDPDRPDKMHSEKEKAVRSDPGVVASEIGENKMPLLYRACWKVEAEQVPCLAGLGKNPGMKLTRAGTWADARSRTEREKRPSIWVHLPHIRLALPRDSQ